MFILYFELNIQLSLSLAQNRGNREKCFVDVILDADYENVFVPKQSIQHVLTHVDSSFLKEYSNRSKMSNCYYCFHR